MNFPSTSALACWLTKNEMCIRDSGWPIPDNMTWDDVEQLLYPGNTGKPRTRPMPEWEQVHRELKRKKSVTLQLLWYEYKQANPDGIQYSQFCAHYREWVRKLDVVMRQTHRAGEKMFVDFAGETVPIVDPASGEIEHAYVYVAVLGALSLIHISFPWSNAGFAVPMPSENAECLLEGLRLLFDCLLYTSYLL